MYSPQITPFQPSNIDATTKMLMGLQQKGQLQQYVAQHKNDPNLVSLALYVSNMSKARPAVQAEANQPKIVDQAIAGMSPPQEMMPEDQGIATLPAPNMQNMAGGGIVAFDDGGEVPGYKTGGTPGDEVFERAFKKVLKFEGGSKYLKDDAGKGPTKYGINQTANPDVDIKNLTEDQAREIYRKRYWNTIGGDALAAKNPQLAIIAFDASVNQGPGTAKQMLAQAGDSPYELLKLRQKRYIDLATPKDTDTPEQAERRKIHKSNLGGWTNRIASLQKDFEQDRNKQNLPALTPGAQAMAATGPESTQPDLDSSKAGIISSGLAALSSAAPAVYEAFTPSFKPGTTMSQALGRTAATAGPLAGLGATGAALSTGAANALSNATPEQLDQLSGDIGSDTGIAAAIMNAPNRPPEKPPMPYGEQMANIAKTIVSAPDRPRKPEPAPEPAPEVAAPQGGMPDLNQAFRQFELGQQNKAEDVQVAKPEITPEAIAAAPKDEKTGGTDWNKLMMQMGLQLMSGKSPNMLTNIGEAGLGTLAMQQAEEKSKSEREAKMSEAEYRKKMGEYYGESAAAIARGAKEKNLELEAEKLVQQHMEKWGTGVGKFATLSDKSAPLAEEARIRQEIYRQLGIKPTMAAGAPALAGGFSVVGSRPS
jgi:hypothetical protein